MTHRSTTELSKRTTRTGDEFSPRSCALPGVHAVEACSRHSFPRHTHDDFGIGIIVRGAHRSWSGRGMVEAGPGDVITCNPGEVHDGRPIGDARTWRMLYLPGDLVTTLGSDINGKAVTQFEFSEPVIAERAKARMFASVYHAMAGRHADPGFAQEHLMMLLAGLLHIKPRTSRHSPETWARAKERIDDDPAAHVTLAQLAREAGMSRFQLLRRFVSGTGLTPHAYIVQRRMDSARAMIAKGDALTAVAVACGFADQSHFNRLFVRRYGLTPGAYARALR